MASRELSPALRGALDGSGLKQRLGEGMVLMVNGSKGVPLSAALSLGEVLASNKRELRLCLHRGSRTSRELGQARGAVLLLAHAGALYKVEAEYDHVVDQEVSGALLSLFRGQVKKVETDAVEYAGGISVLGHKIVDPDEVLVRWNLQIDCLRTLRPSSGVRTFELG